MRLKLRSLFLLSNRVAPLHFLFVIVIWACSGPPVTRPKAELGDFPLDISWDNTLVLFHHRLSEEGVQGLYLVSTTGQHAPRLLWPYANEFDAPYDAKLSPDGGQIAMTRRRELALYDIATEDEFVVTSLSHTVTSPDWHPDGKKIVFTSVGCGGENADLYCGIRIYDLEKDTVSQIRHEGEWVHGDNPTWSPTGALVAFRSGGARTSHIFTIDPQGLNRVNQTPNDLARWNSSPKWLSEKEIIFLSVSTENSSDIQYRVVNIETGMQAIWKSSDPLEVRIRFSRDGQIIAFPAECSNNHREAVFIQGFDDDTGSSRLQLTTFTPVESLVGEN